jgi:hypothetical protein
LVRTLNDSYTFHGINNFLLWNFGDNDLVYY